MYDLVQFLRDRFDEDEQTARAAAWDEGDSLYWTTHHREQYDGRWVIVDRLDDRVTEISAEASEDGPVAEHIARHDPARVLAEVDAKRRILLLHNIPAVVSPKMAAFGLRDGEAPEDDRRCAGCGLDDMDDPITPDVSECPILRALALPYADHPGYRAEWATQPPDHED